MPTFPGKPSADAAAALAFVAIALAGAILLYTQQAPVPLDQTMPSANLTVLHYFFLPGCPHCAAEEPVLRELSTGNAGIRVVFHDVGNPDEKMLFMMYASGNGLDPSKLGTPTTFVETAHGVNRTLVGFHSLEEFESAVAPCASNCADADWMNPEARPPLDESPSSAPLPIAAFVFGFQDATTGCALWAGLLAIGLMLALSGRVPRGAVILSFLGGFALSTSLFVSGSVSPFLLLGYAHAAFNVAAALCIGGGVAALLSQLGTRTVNPPEEASWPGLACVAVCIVVAAFSFAAASLDFACSAIPASSFEHAMGEMAVSGIQAAFSIGVYAFVSAALFTGMLFSAAIAFPETTGHPRAASRVIGGVILVLAGLFLAFAPRFLA